MRNKFEVDLPQKTVPPDFTRGRLVHRPPTVPSPETQPLNSATTHVPLNGHELHTQGVIEQLVTREGGHGESNRLMSMIPVVEKPLKPVYYTAVGGGRVGGGGTSTEALRRAKKKAKQRHL